jgi:hypothetical protein
MVKLTTANYLLLLFLSIYVVCPQLVYYFFNLYELFFAAAALQVQLFIRQAAGAGRSILVVL